jgi:twinkle protein
VAGDLIQGGDYVALPDRCLTEATARKWGYRRAKDRKGKWVLVQDVWAPDGSAVVAQKLRYPDKEFAVLGDMRAAGLVGQHLWRDGGKRVCITEGELDAAALSQAFGHQWPVVSLKNGAQSAAKDIAAQIEWLNRFEEVVLVFDMDEPGQKAARDAAAVLPPRKAKIARLPLKDACDMLKAGRSKELVDATWGAKEYRPDGIVTIADVREDAIRPVTAGLPWFLPSLTAATYGRRMGDLVALGAGTGIGKTDFLAQQMLYDLTVLNERVAVFALEQEPTETVLRLAGKLVGKALHVPDESRPQADVVEAIDALPADRLFLYNHFGVADWGTIRERIRYLYHAAGVRLFYLDHLTALAAQEPEREREVLEKVMGELGGLVKEIPIWLLFVSHLATPEGKPHEEGGRVAIRHFKGARAIGFWSLFMLGLERNQQAEDEDERQTTTLRVLKDRYTGRSTGRTISLGYDSEAGRLYERDAPDRAHPHPFREDEGVPF